ncbi:MAG: TRAP transporter permease [Beijerinckiaceae bacterium]
MTETTVDTPLTHSEEAGRITSVPGALRVLLISLSVIFVLASIAKSTDLFRTALGLQIYDQQFYFPMIAVGIVLVFLHFTPQGEKRTGMPPWYDWLAAALGTAACLYLAVEYPRLATEVVYQPIDAVVCGAIIIVLTAEGLRRTVGVILLAVLLFFIAFGIAGQYVPGPLQGQRIEFGDLVTYLAFDTNALVGVPMRVVTTIVVAFLLMAALMTRSGAAGFMNDLSIALMGRYRGGAAKVAITASSLFGSISGSTVANVMSTGAITIPLMKRGGYPPVSAGAIEAVASTGGQLMPPVMGAVAFLMAEDLQVSYAEVAIAALVPSVLYYAGLFVQADLEAARDNISRVEEHLIPKAGDVLKRGWIFVTPFVVLIASLFWFNHEPEEAALYASLAFIALGLLVGYQGRRMSLKDVFWSVAETGILAIDLIMIGAAVGFIIGILAKSGLGFALTLVLSQIGAGNFLLLLVLAAVVCIILGMGMPTIGVYVLVAALVAPAMIETGVSPMAAHMFVLYFGMLSFITPPICIAAFAAAKLSGADQMKTGYAASRFGWSAFVVPFLFVFSPSLLLEGDPLRLAYDVATALAGVWLVSAALVGYLFGHLTNLQRIALVVGGLLVLTPASAFPGAVWTDISGALISAVVLIPVWRRSRRATVQAA